MASSRSIDPQSPPNCQVPKQIRETLSPLLPSWMYSMALAYPLCLDTRHGLRHVPLAGCDAGWEDLLEDAQLLGGQLDVCRRGVLLEPVDLPCPGDRHHLLVAVQQPGERELRRRATDLAGDLDRAAHELE